MSLNEWLPFAGTIIAALIAGVFAVYQLYRSNASQRELEREKLVSARTEAELAAVRSSTREYQQAQVLPFLERLDKALNESYKTAYLPPYFPNLGGYIPQLRRYGDKAMGDWLRAVEDMSRYRIRLLLVLNQERVETVTRLLTQFIDSMQNILKVRNEVWFKKATEQDLWGAQRSHVAIGYQLMMEIRDAVSEIPKEQAPISESAKKSLSDALTMSFEKASAVSIPYGSNPDYCWIALWEVDMRPDWQEFAQSITGASHQEFEQQLTNLAHSMYEKKSYLDVKLTKVTMDDLEVPCMAVSFASARKLESFLDSELENYRQNNNILWSSFRSPIEIVVGTNKEQTTERTLKTKETAQAINP